jgi:hypothetical protein
MVGGWTAAADLQPRFDPVADTVSALAAQALWPLAVVLSCCRRPVRVAATVPSADGRNEGTNTVAGV